MAKAGQRVILTNNQLSLTIERLCQQLIENHQEFTNTILLGLQPRGIHFSSRIHQRLTEILHDSNPKYGVLDASFHRDDFRRNEKIIKPSETNIDFPIEGKRVVLIDDVLYTGRSIRAAMDALMTMGRPEKVELMVLIDRRFSRDLPIQADYVGKQIDSISSEKVKVEWEEQHGKTQILLIQDKIEKIK